MLVISEHYVLNDSSDHYKTYSQEKTNDCILCGFCDGESEI